MYLLPHLTQTDMGGEDAAYTVDEGAKPAVWLDEQGPTGGFFCTSKLIPGEGMTRLPEHEMLLTDSINGEPIKEKGVPMVRYVTDQLNLSRVYLTKFN